MWPRVALDSRDPSTPRETDHTSLLNEKELCPQQQRVGHIGRRHVLAVTYDLVEHGTFSAARMAAQQAHVEQVDLVWE
jgi:hypothetical protein